MCTPESIAVEYIGTAAKLIGPAVATPKTNQKNAATIDKKIHGFQATMLTFLFAQ